MNKYAEMKKRHQKEIDDFPLYFAFSNEQFDEVLEELNLSKDKNSEEYFGNKLCKIPYGGFCLKEDSKKFCEMLSSHSEEISKAIDCDKTGEGFIYDMFYYELKNHEYGYTCDPEDTLDSLGITEEMLGRENIRRGFMKACMKIEQEEM